MTDVDADVNEVAESSRSLVAVPWSHVLPFAVLLSFANGFWLIVVRGAVGSVARTSEPFVSWLRESTLLVPAYVAAVLVGFALGCRWAGLRPRGLRSTAVALALIAGAGWTLGVLVQAASSLLDLRLQIDDIQHMGAHSECDTTCVSEQIQDTWGLELKAVLVGAVLLAVTDVVMVALTYAARGGNLVLGRSPAPSRSSAGVAPRAAGADQRLLLVTGLVGAALIHVAVTPQHLREWTAAGVFFILLALAEAGTAASLLSSRPAPRARSLWAAAAVSLVPLVTWAMSRTVGIPFGPEAWEPEPVGVADCMACVLELTALVIAIGLLRHRRTGTAWTHPSTRRPWSRYGLGIAVASMLTATTLGIAGSTLPLVDAFPGLGNHHVDEATEGAP